MKNLYSAWKSSNHASAYNFWNNISKRYFKYLYGSFMENKYLLSIIKNTTLNIGEIGCANGYLKRFLDLNKCYNPYKGFDISEQAIKNAKKFYGENYFHLINENDKLKIINKKKFDIIYSRDTVPHQKDPYKFLEELISITSKFLILRLRTRNFGKTQLDYNLSCQLQPGDIWAPYIILNYSEFLNYLKSKKNIKSISVNRSYNILGGQNFRYLEKELYLESTKGAETSVCIHFSEKNIDNKVINETFDLEGHDFVKKNKYKTFFYKILNKLSI